MPYGPITTNINPTFPFGAYPLRFSPNVRIGGSNVVIAPSPLTPHGPIPGHGELMPAFIASGSATVRVNGFGVVRQGDVASCGDQATGNTFLVNAGD